MSDWNPAAFNWREVLASAGFEPRWWFVFLCGVAVGPRGEPLLVLEQFDQYGEMESSRMVV